MGADLAASIDKFLADPAVATAVLGAIQSPDTRARIAEAPAYGRVVLASRKSEHTEFPGAEVRSPVATRHD